MRKHGLYLNGELIKTVEGKFEGAVRQAEIAIEETGIMHYAKPLEEIRTDNTYELLAVRYRKEEEGLPMRCEFSFFEAEKAMQHYIDLQRKNYAFVTLTIVTAKRT